MRHKALVVVLLSLVLTASAFAEISEVEIDNARKVANGVALDLSHKGEPVVSFAIGFIRVLKGDIESTDEISVEKFISDMRKHVREGYLVTVSHETEGTEPVPYTVFVKTRGPRPSIIHEYTIEIVW